jgi:hypothetical protein
MRNVRAPQDADDPLLRRPDTIEGLIFSLPKEWRYGETVPTVRHIHAFYVLQNYALSCSRNSLFDSMKPPLLLRARSCVGSAQKARS